jgi:hypothetical protein
MNPASERQRRNEDPTPLAMTNWNGQGDEQLFIFRGEQQLIRVPVIVHLLATTDDVCSQRAREKVEQFDKDRATGTPD